MFRYFWVFSLALVSCGEQNSPTGFNGNLAEKVNSNLEEESTGQIESRTIVIKHGSVRVTNSSGGKVIIVGNDEDLRKPIIIHFDFDGNAEAFQSSGLALCADLVEVIEYRQENPDGSTTFGLTDTSSDPSPVGTGGQSRCIRDLEKRKIVVNRTRRQGDFSTGHWREWETSVEFTFFSDNHDWTIENQLHRGVYLEVTNPHPSNIVFHPVVPADSVGWDLSAESRERNDLDREVELAARKSSRFSHLLAHSPIDIANISVGSSVIIDTTHWAFVDGSFSCPSERDFGCLAIAALESPFVFSDCSGEFGLSHSGRCVVEDDDRGTNLDFHIAVVSPRIHGGLRAGGGGAFLETPYSFVNQLDVSSGFDDIAWSILHEMGHNLGLDHVLSAGSEVINDVNYPVLGGMINAHGYEVENLLVIDSKNPDEYFDFMTYSNPKWISAYHYRKMAEYRFGIDPTLAWGRRVVLDPVIRNHEYVKH